MRCKRKFGEELLGKHYKLVSLRAQLVKNPPAMRETWVQSLGWEDPLEKERLPTLVFWPGDFHGLYSSWGRKETDTIERLSLSLFSLEADSFVLSLFSFLGPKNICA